MEFRCFVVATLARQLRPCSRKREALDGGELKFRLGQKPVAVPLCKKISRIVGLAYLLPVPSSAIPLIGFMGPVSLESLSNLSFVNNKKKKKRESRQT